MRRLQEKRHCGLDPQSPSRLQYWLETQHQNHKISEVRILIKIIDYKAGNAPSVLSAVEYIGYNAELVHTADELAGATHIILPGVGSARATMDSLRELRLLDALHDAVLNRGTMFLGICVGMQILFEHSEEGDTDCLGWFGGTVTRFDSACVNVPQMGWNQVSFTDKNNDGYYYFVNSYHANPTDESIIWGTADYDGVFTAAVRRGNIYGAQFHTEKSGAVGLELLREFLSTSNIEKGGR